MFKKIIACLFAILAVLFIQGCWEGLLFPPLPPKQPLLSPPPQKKQPTFRTQIEDEEEVKKPEIKVKISPKKDIGVIFFDNIITNENNTSIKHIDINFLSGYIDFSTSTHINLDDEGNFLINCINYSHNNYYSTNKTTSCCFRFFYDIYHAALREEEQEAEIVIKDYSDKIIKKIPIKINTAFKYKDENKDLVKEIIFEEELKLDKTTKIKEEIRLTGPEWLKSAKNQLREITEELEKQKLSIWTTKETFYKYKNQLDDALQDTYSIFTKIFGQPKEYYSFNHYRETYYKNRFHESPDGFQFEEPYEDFSHTLSPIKTVLNKLLKGLELPKTATFQEVKRKCHKMSLKLHPDKLKQWDEKSKEEWYKLQNNCGKIKEIQKKYGYLPE